MPIVSIADTTTRTERLITSWTTLQNVFATSPSLTGEQVGDLLAQVRSVLDDVLTLIGDLEALDPLSLISDASRDGRKTIELWTWRLGLRPALLEFSFDARRLVEDLEELDLGTGEVLVVVREGDTLQSIAAQQLGAFTQWTRIADRNPGVTPLTLAVGQTLAIPPRTTPIVETP